jgi:transcriptional regulator with XRE-family HTH domain
MTEQELKGVLGKNIKLFRFRRQFSQAYLAEKADISVTFLSNIERGNNFPQAGTLCSLARALEAPVWELFRETESAEEPPELIDRMTEDFRRQISGAIEAVYSLYKA